MDWKTFFVQLIMALAWPAVVIFIVYQLKDRLAELLPRLKKLKHKDTEFEFSEKLNELVIEAENNQESSASVKKPELNEQFNFLLKLAEISPRSSVIETYRVLETASAKALAKTYPELDTKHLNNPVQMLNLLKGKVLTESQLRQFNELRKLRNQAAHMEDFELKSMPVGAYIDIALTLASNLENHKP